jgi:hemolysin activation/secretion protein
LTEGGVAKAAPPFSFPPFSFRLEGCCNSTSTIEPHTRRMANTRLRSSLSSAGAQWKKHCALVACAAAGTLNLSDVIAQTQAPAEATPAPAGAASEPVAPEQQFSVFEMRVLGNTVLANQQIEKAVYPFLGEHKSFNDIETARLALETAYK